MKLQHYNNLQNETRSFRVIHDELKETDERKEMYGMVLNKIKAAYQAIIEIELENLQNNEDKNAAIARLQTELKAINQL